MNRRKSYSTKQQQRKERRWLAKVAKKEKKRRRGEGKARGKGGNFHTKILLSGGRK